MANSLTGDFGAVLQVSGNTINRLLATMHQNGFSDKKLPSFPHSVSLHIGTPNPIDGVIGMVRAQIGTPRIELLNGSTDTFRLEVAVRARFWPDSGSTDFPTFIHGTARALYRIHDIDPNCVGWSSKASGYIWVRVVRDSVEFQGTTGEDRDLGILIAPTDEAAALEKVRRQVAGLLATRFEATPHKVSSRFQKGSMRSIGFAGATAVVAPVAMNGTPSGSIASVNGVFLDGADFGIAMSRDAVLALAEPVLAPLRTFTKTVPVQIHTIVPGVPTIHATYHATVNPPVVEWHAFGSFAVVKIKMSGEAKTESKLPDAKFDVEQDITVNFDSGNEKLGLSVGSRKVSTDVGGPFGWLIKDRVNSEIHAAVQAEAEDACKDAQSTLDAAIARKQELNTQLQTFDKAGYARFGEAVFLPDGMILRGWISLSPRRPLVVKLEKTAEQDGYTALQSWIPGGRIDRLEWTWGWFSGKQAGSLTLTDRFILRRPKGGGTGPWGLVTQLTTPLPGLDGSGKMCLRVRGVRVDPVTGQYVQVNSKSCLEFGFMIAGSVDDFRNTYPLAVPDVPELSQDVPFPQLALIDVRSTVRPASSANTLMVYATNDSFGDLAAVLREGLSRVRRPDAGLGLAVLVPEGQLSRVRGGSFADVESVCEPLGLAVILVEDVGGRWAASFDLQQGRDQLAWRLLSPDGKVTWRHNGTLGADALVPALEEHLVLSGSPKLDPYSPIVDVGRVIGVELLDPNPIYRASDCPPFPLNRAGVGTLVTFVEGTSAASQAQIRRLAERHRDSGSDAAALVVVVRGADRREAEAFQRQMGLDIVALPDPELAITRRFGVRVWPTTFTLDAAGTVARVESGVGTDRPEDDPHRKDDVTCA